MGVQYVTNAGDLAGRHRLFADAAREQFARAAGQHALFLLDTAHELSSGMLWGGQVPTPEQLRAAGYPYSRMKPANSAPTPDYVINIQTGQFLNGWHARAEEELDGWVVMTWNESDHARYMMGTRRMRYRGIVDEIGRRGALHMQSLITAALLANAKAYSFGSAAASPFGGGGALLFALWTGTSAGVNTVRQAI